MTEPVVTTSAVVDDLVTEDGAVVLVDSARGPQVLRLSPLAQAVREIAQGGVPLTLLTHDLFERFGAPPDGQSDAVLAVVEQLASAGVVTVER